MKNLTKLFLLAMLVVFASCQNETLTEGASSRVEEELSMEDEILVSDGEEDETFILNNDLEGEMPAQPLTFSMSSALTSAPEADLEGFELSLPDVVSIQTTEKPTDAAYFALDVLNTNLAGTNLEGWCVDVDLSLGVEGPLDFDVYSSYEELPAGKFENPQNFDLVNYIMNQNYVGKASPSGGAYTFGHVQWAIWELIDDRNCQSCTYLTNPTGDWRDDASNITKGQEIVDAALANGEGFTPAVGQKIAVVLIPEGKQSIIIMKDVPAKEVPCSDCEGEVTKLELEFDWGCAKKIDILQRDEDTCYGKWIYCNRNAQPGEIINISGGNHDGTFGRYIYIYINNCYYTKIKTNCYLKIGPGYTKGVFNVISGESSHGGELCEYVKPDTKCYRHWNCYNYYNYCIYGYY
ncbi:hypothetical protein DIS18_09325 [Algibacter marinivivus]|uniref:Lamin Tail Domain n=1 Tax=Algibacter marinivivus TaxID=2100723 RepID=A0A2U2X3T9_9FLAO|nr:hypothetical protein [Algibacter marinivivus]PWH82445.1 hypothetical protein DIS18_09325 [Algibacter marinivivus]